MPIRSILSSTNSYIVEKGDVFDKIAERCISVNMPGYSGLSLYNSGINKLKSFNPDIEDIDLIYVGQKIILQGTADRKTVNKSQTAKITNFGLQSNTDRTVFATWAWDNPNTDYYEVLWKYGTGDSVGFIGERQTTTEKHHAYSSAPENATNVTFRVRPISKTKKSGDNEIHYWTAGWSTEEKYYFIDNPPSKAPTPTVSINGYKLTAKLDNLDINATSIQFQIVKIEKNTSSIFKNGTAKISNGTSTYSANVEAGAEYKVRCRGIKDNQYGDWSDYSSVYSSSPSATDGIYLLYVIGASSDNNGYIVGINWYDVDGVDGYDIQYTHVKRYFDSNPQGVSTVSLVKEDDAPNNIVGHAEISGLTGGLEYFFRVRSIKNDKKSDWSEIKSIAVGSNPTAPTTWSSGTTVNSGEPLTLYWMHNSEDGSKQTGAELQLSIDGQEPVTYKLYETVTCYSSSDTPNKVVDIDSFELETNSVIRVVMLYANTNANPTLNVGGIGEISINGTDEYSVYWNSNSIVEFTYNGANWIITKIDSQQGSSSYSINTNDYPEGTVIVWRVRTSGILKDDNGDYIYGPWSIERAVNIYSPPSVSVTITDSNGNYIEQLESFPIYISISSNSSALQKPIGYYLTITANSSYETLDNIGNKKMINEGGVVYRKLFNESSSPLNVILSANDLDLENNVSYTVKCTVSMSSGLTGESSEIFTVAWSDSEYWPTAEIGYDKDTYSTFIRPYCETEDIVSLSLYRRNFDGSFTELATGLSNNENTYITDPHPSLDYARYRVVAANESTGAISYYDVPGYPINEYAAIIQWDETWTDFDVNDEDEPSEHSWSGSLIRLPYNIDISDDNEVDVELVEYIGRKYPVGYYGTQLTHNSTWDFVIPKEDKDTIYALRRLATWNGNVYVREPSGSGYWASISVSFSQKHNELTIPITLKVRRVEGGV